MHSSQDSIIKPSSEYAGQVYDILIHAWMGKYTGWLSPASFSLAIHDWLSHLAISPAKQLSLVKDATEKGAELLFDFFSELNFDNPEHNIFPIIEKTPDQRFKENAWQQFPYSLYTEAFLLAEAWWQEATSNIRGVSAHHKQVVKFIARQYLDMFSPSNFALTNPTILEVAMKEGGANFVRGLQNFFDDALRFHYNLPSPETLPFQVGIDVAITPGKVIYRNNLIELIQYEPTTKKVYTNPVLIIPAWINKYYILDLSSHNSLVKYLVGKGHTVFMISWKNPTSDDRHLGFEDYLNLGALSATDVISTIIPKTKINMVGYCLGGTLLMMAAAAMVAQNDERINSITLFATQIDFHDPGELSLFVDQSQVTYLEDIMWEKGYLDNSQMTSAFSMLRSSDLIWSRVVHEYLLGKRQSLNDLMAWNLDGTRLPFRMHSEYLNSLFLKNDLVEGHYSVNKKRINLSDITAPIFSVATVKDHVAPWKSVYKIHLFTNTDITFLLTNGGHNAGIVSEIGHKGREYQIHLHQKNDKHIGANRWLEIAEKHKGSWWPAWEKWLANLSGEKVSPPTIGNPSKDYPILCDAPGKYVLEK